MGIGASIFLIALGAILTFAVNFDVSGLDINVIGIILMIVGVIGLLMFLLVWGPRSRARVARSVPLTERRVYEEPTVYEERPPL